MLLIVAILVYMTSKGPVIYYATCIGKNGREFRMPKFRTMLIKTPILPSHELINPSCFLTPIGGFLRSFSLDETLQLFSILKGDMIFIGPRPSLTIQRDLNALRKEGGIDNLMPGITGWAQVNGRDKLSLLDKVALDMEYLNRQSFWFDIKILWMTFLKVISRDGVNHY
jgi:O-antigen biosynthesis protein WbqP